MIEPDERPKSARSPLRIRLLIAALAVAGMLGLVIAAVVGTGDSGQSVGAAGGAVKRVIPADGDEVLQQQRVGVVLDSRYRLDSLVVYPNGSFSGGIDVTADVEHMVGLNRFEFAPGSGQLIEALSPDANCARAVFVLIARPEESGTARWCFEVS